MRNIVIVAFFFVFWSVEGAAISGKREINPRGLVTQTDTDAMGRVLSVASSFGTESSTWDLNGNPLTTTDRGGHTTSYVHDAANRMTIKREPESRTTNLVHDALGHVIRETVGSGPDGDGDPRVTETVYDHPLYLPTLTRRALDAATWASVSADYDGNGNPTFNRDAEGRETTRIFDNRDRLISQTEPLGRITTFSYDNADRKLTETLANPSGSGDQTRRWEYDAAGRNTATVDASGGRRVSAYDAHGNVLSRRDARGNPTDFSYDARHHVLTRSGPESGQLLSYAYDLNGNAIGETWANGRAITRTFDLLDRLLDSRDGTGFFEKLTYTPDGQVLTRRDGNDRLTTNHYDDLHRLERQDLPAIAGVARQTAQTFTPHGEVETATDANGNTTTHTYDALGRRIRTTRPEVDGAAATTHTGYDLVGNITRSTDARGNITHYTVDALNRRTGQTDPADGEGVVYTQSWSYDQAGNATRHDDRRGIVSETHFDKENRILGTRRAGLTLSTLSRDADVRTTFDALARLTTTTFDKASRKIQEVRPGATERWTWTTENDLATHTDADARIQHFTYDARRQLVAETNGAGETTEHTYDGAGHRLTSQRPLGDADHRWVSTWDEGDRLASVTDPQGHSTTYRYDAHGNRTAILDANNHTTGFAYDARHRLIRKTYPAVGTETAQAHWTWDADDNEASHTTPNGALITSTHDALNRRTDQTIDTAAAGEVRSTHWVFDGNANLTTIRETVQEAGERSETRRYDAFDRLEAVTDSYGKTLGYGYDPVGNRTRLTDAEGEITEYTYDALNHNRKVTVPGQGITAQTWLPSGRLETIARPNGSTTTQAYDAAGRLETIHHSNPGGVIAQLRYRYDLNGNRIEQKETNGAVTENSEQTTGYEYDRADRLVTVREPARTLTYTLDAVGNRTTETVTDESAILVSQSTLSYDERDRLTDRSDPLQALIISQTWDADGNRTGQTINGEARTFTYDARDRLVTLQQPGAPPLSFDYDSHGLRTKKAQGAAETRYQYDQSSLIAETNAIGNTLSRLHYGATQLLARTEAGSTPSYRNYLLDALASPIVLTHQDGSISARTQYDAFGEILAQQGTAGQLTTPNPNAATATLLTTDQQPIGFTGYQKDEESGLYYARARYYDPMVGRFTTEDPEAGKAEMPPSLHRYLYAYANPTVYVDPTGRYAEAGHYYTTYYVALRVGYSDEQAQKLAFYSQLPDEVDRLDAIGVQADSVLGEWGIGAVNAWLSATPSVVPLSVAPTAATRTRDEVQVGFHSLVGSTGREQTALTLAAMRNASDDLNTTGLLIHRLGDTFSHCPNRGECFDTGWGHGGEGTTPDVIQTAPKDYLAYVETLTAALAEQRGASADEVKQLRESVRAELQDVADIATFDARPAIPAWKPGGWMDSPPPPVYDAMIAKPRQRSDDELQSRSQAMLREKLSRQGAEVQYAPESLPGGFDEYDVYVPHFQTARTLDQALADFAVSSGRMMSAQEAQAALAKVRKLIEAQRADARSEPVVIVEGRSNYPAAKVQE